MCVCVYIHIHIYIHTYIYIYTHTHTHKYIVMCIYCFGMSMGSITAGYVQAELAPEAIGFSSLASATPPLPASFIAFLLFSTNSISTLSI